MIIKCIAIEDEPLALDQIEAYINKVDFLQLEKKFSNAIEPISYLKENKVDLIFLDIEMEEFTGLQLLNMLTHRPKVILTTAYDKYALDAFDLDVSDYLLKPISFERFLKAVDKVYLSCKPKKLGEEKESNNTAKEYIFVKTTRKVQRVNFRDIIYIEGQKEYLRVYTEKEKIMTLMTFKEMLALLPDNFVRIHNSYIVSLDKVKSIEDQTVILTDNILPISNSYKTAFFNLLKLRKLIN